ncbi:hypothetical protein LSH36_1768g00010 [Paralvinella palmiformis]|uniref:Uncharacterized protein n=1 Tax=Paralvinella palmiformis TaxID=53620 RepID=A0AAD9IR85_9ANNE|nr:hypothetical protein LSH36_1768g00010 [Paralvinella palmiformis]
MALGRTEDATRKETRINYDCAACDSYAERQDRVGCRLWCNIDVAEADDIWLAEEMENAWTNTWGCAALGGCDEAAYSAALKEEMQVCDLEITRSFALLAISDPASDPNLIDLSDMYAWRDTIRNDYNAGGDCTEAAYQQWWAVTYPQFEDPDCPDGL